MFYLKKVLLSHRYGARCLPTRILSKEYDIFRNELDSSRDSNDNSDMGFKYKEVGHSEYFEIQNLFEFCYELDENEIPSRYKLKRIDEIIPEYDEKVNIILETKPRKI